MKSFGQLLYLWSSLLSAPHQPRHTFKPSPLFAHPWGLCQRSLKFDLQSRLFSDGPSDFTAQIVLDIYAKCCFKQQHTLIRDTPLDVQILPIQMERLPTMTRLTV